MRSVDDEEEAGDVGDGDDEMVVSVRTRSLGDAMAARRGGDEAVSTRR